MQSFQGMLKSVKQRPRDLGIITRDRWLRELTVCLGGKCPSGILEGVTQTQWRGWLKATSQQVAYTDVDMVLSEGGVWTPADIKAVDGNVIPPHTIATFPAVVTSTRQDRDGDVLESKGASPDPLSPLLWQHIPDMPVGRSLGFDSPTDRLLRGRFTIASTPLGQDAALLAEHGALRISHGFLPTKWEPLDNHDPFSGYHILEFKILEVSLVSVPSNPDAVIEAFSREKLAHPLVKAWASVKFKERPTISSVGIDLSALSKLPPGSTITIGGDKPTLPDKTACTCHLHDKGPAHTLVKDVIPFKDALVSKSDTWDAEAAVKGVRQWAGVTEDNPPVGAWEKYGQAFALCLGETDNFTSYKLPYKQVEDGKLVINAKGVSAGIGALNGGRGGGMDISEEDRKGAYGVLTKAYKKAYPDQDPPELKSATAQWYKGIYVDLTGSYERIIDQLKGKLRPYLLFKGKAGEADWIRLAATYADHGVACVLEDALMPGVGCCAWDDANACYYRIPWGTVDGEPTWTGEPVEVPVGDLLAGPSKAAYERFVKGFMKASHMKKLNAASDRLQKAYDHEDAKAGPKQHVKRAKAHVDAVISDHDDDDGDEKGFVTDAHRERLKKAMGYCSKALDHEHTTETMAKHIKAAHEAIKSVMDAHDDDDDGEKGNKTGRAISAANEKKLTAAKGHLKAIADDDEAHAEVAKAASDGVDSIDGIFAAGHGGDSGTDFDDEGNFVGTDVGAYTDGEPNKAGKVLSKRNKELIAKAVGHAQAIIDHEHAGEDHKGLATAAKTKLKSVMGEGAGDDGPALGTDTSTAEPGQGEPAKSFAERCHELLREAVSEHAMSDDIVPLLELTTVGAKASNLLRKPQAVQA
jgi:HK97 family phage prohead protease